MLGTIAIVLIVLLLLGFVSAYININKAVELTRGVSGVTSVKIDMRVKGQ